MRSLTQVMSGRLSSHSLDLPRQRSKIPLLARPETRTCWGVQTNAPHRSLASSRKAMLLVITVFFWLLHTWANSNVPFMQQLSALGSLNKLALIPVWFCLISYVHSIPLHGLITTCSHRCLQWVRHSSPWWGYVQSNEQLLGPLAITQCLKLIFHDQKC